MIADLLASALQRSHERTLTVMDLLNVAGQLQAAGEVAAVATLYATWIEHNGDNPILYAVHFNHAVVLSNTGNLEGAKHALMEAIRLNPDFYPPYINLGHVMERMGLNGDAVGHWYAVSNRLATVTGDNVGYKTAALKQVGRLLEKSNYDAHAEDALRLSLELNPNQSDVIQHWVSLRQRQCKWPVIRPWSTVTRHQLLDGISTLSLDAYSDDPLLQLANAYVYAKVDVGQPPVSFHEGHAAIRAAAHPTRRKIGYISSDLREHAVGFLTTEIYGLHDRSKVEVFVYYCGIPSSDEIHLRVKETSDHFLDLAGMNDEEASRRMAADGIEILIDLNGYTNGARSKVFAMRPAPINVNWLGYPGTLGSPYHHYIIADDFIIPPGSELYYAEKVLRLPCYQPNDRKRVVSNQPPTRKDVGLPEDGTVFCCFNGVHKITHFTWSRWMTILKQVPGSVLWLLEGIDTTSARLKELAAAAGVAPERLVFAAKRRNPDHLARYSLADLFLDTSPYGAHTTCSDALWMGVPVLTLVGRGFASRVCGSLISAAGLGELVCETPEDFIAKAVELGLDKAKRDALREKLLANRDTCVLFDTPLLVSRLEGLYQQMWDEYTAGKMPRPDLANLDVYNDIGIALDKDGVDMLTVPNYLDLYRDALKAKNEFSYLRPDSRLWAGGPDTVKI
jgi:predicted O-linked N-acetylglucosamine transferase (SPINDLY family)